MSARIRGHYRIDSAGRVESMVDVNGAALQFHPEPASLPGRDRSRLMRMSIATFVVAILGVGGMLALPQIQRALISAQAARFASVRHLHGHVMREAAEKLLNRDTRDER